MIKINTSFIVKWEKIKIKKEFNINDIEKKFDFIKKRYPSEIVAVNLIELYYFLINFENKSYIRDVLKIFFLIFNYIKLAFTNILKKEKYDASDLIIFSKHKFVDQFNFSETSNYLHKKNKKHLIVLNHKKNDFKKISKLYKNKNIINLADFLNFKNILKAVIKFALHLHSINKIISILNCKKIRFQVYKLFFDFFIKTELWCNIFKKHKIEKLFLSYFSRDNALIYANKIKNKKIQFVGYAFTGLDGNTPRYLFHGLDKLLVLGKSDTKIIKDINKFKLRFMSLPKKTLVVGSTRHDYFFKRKNTKNIKKNIFKILYIKSNPFYLDGLEDKAIILFSKIMNNFKNLKYTIKDRENTLSLSIQKLIKEKIIKKKQIEKSGPIEKSIHKADLCVGTNSTALLRQAISFNKPIIQLYAKKHYMWNTSRKLSSANNEKEIISLIKKLSNNKKIYNKYLNLNKKMKKFILSNELRSNKKIYEILK